MKIKYFLAGLLSVVVLSTFVQSAVFAQVQEACSGLEGQALEDCMKTNAPAPDSCSSQHFLTFPAWYNGLAQSSGDGGCDIKSPNDVGGVGGFIWIIVFNVVTMLLMASGYAAVAFIIYGGYKYMISAGSPDGIVAARKTIMNAVIGLAISIAAVAIVNTISNGLKVGG